LASSALPTAVRHSFDNLIGLDIGSWHSTSFLLQRTNSVAIGGTADMPRTRRARRSDAFDPYATLVVHCGSSFDARFEPFNVPV
jgi:hypothetical protein